MRRLKMSAKTKVVVLHMKELIYTLIFAGLGILLIFLLLFMFLPGKEDGESVETMRYVAGVYTSSIQFGEHAVDMQVIVDENRIQSVSMVNLDETVETMYPLMEPALENITVMICRKSFRQSHCARRRSRPVPRRCFGSGSASPTTFMI